MKYSTAIVAFIAWATPASAIDCTIAYNEQVAKVKAVNEELGQLAENKILNTEQLSEQLCHLIGLKYQANVSALTLLQNAACKFSLPRDPLLAQSKANIADLQRLMVKAGCK